MRYHFRALARERIRNRRYDVHAAQAWCERFCEHSRARVADDGSHIPLSFMLVLHEKQDAPTTLGIADTFRDTGFVVTAKGYAGIVATGEACRVIAFMLMAGKAGLLCEEFEHFLDVTVDARATLRDEDRNHVAALAKTLSSIKFVCPVRRRTVRPRKRSRDVPDPATRERG